MTTFLFSIPSLVLVNVDVFQGPTLILYSSHAILFALVDVIIQFYNRTNTTHICVPNPGFAPELQFNT